VDANEHNVLLVRYEDMRADPVGEFSRMLEHAGVDVDHNRVVRAVEATSLAQLKAKEEKEGFRESSFHAKNQFFGTGATGGKQLSTRLSTRVTREFGRVMKKLGYIGKAKNGTVQLH
jgi:hypothetical protein